MENTEKSVGAVGGVKTKEQKKTAKLGKNYTPTANEIEKAFKRLCSI